MWCMKTLWHNLRLGWKRIALVGMILWHSWIRMVMGCFNWMNLHCFTRDWMQIMTEQSLDKRSISTSKMRSKLWLHSSMKGYSARWLTWTSRPSFGSKLASVNSSTTFQAVINILLGIRQKLNAWVLKVTSFLWPVSENWNKWLRSEMPVTGSALKMI